MATLQDWVQGFEKEMQHRFNPGIRIIAIEGDIELSMPLITNITSKCAGVAYQSLLNKVRGRLEISDARMVAIYFCKKMLQLKDNKIAMFFNRDRTTIRNAYETIKDRLYTKDEKIVKLTDAVAASLQDILTKRLFNSNEQLF
jgi:chromosomal replication initiation ATPase DnaA